MIKKRMGIGIVTLMLILAGAVSSFAASGYGGAAPGVVTPQFVSVTSVTMGLTFSGSTANVKVKVQPKSGMTITKINETVKLMKVGNSTAVKTWTTTVYANQSGDFSFYETYAVPSRGTYYVSATIKCYNGSTLLEEFTRESTSATY